MLDHTENNLRAAIKSLSDVVMPAVDPEDPMAREQLALVVAFLEFTRSRVYDIHARQRVELDHGIALARALGEDAGAVSRAAAERLAAAIDAATRALADSRSGTRELRDATQALGATVRGVIRAARGADAAVQERIEASVRERSEPLLALHGAWYAPLGFDPEAGAGAPLAELLAQGTGDRGSEPPAGAR